MARKNRKWYQKKTNWTIISAVASQLLLLHPATAAFAPVVLKIAAASGVYAVADRAGKSNEDPDIEYQ